MKKEKIKGAPAQEKMMDDFWAERTAEDRVLKGLDNDMLKAGPVFNAAGEEEGVLVRNLETKKIEGYSVNPEYKERILRNNKDIMAIRAAEEKAKKAKEAKESRRNN